LDSDHDVMTTRAAAELLGVSLRTVQLWVERGALTAWKTIGGHRRVLRSSVDALLAKRPPPRDEPNQLRLLVVEDDRRLRRLYELEIPAWKPAVKIDLAADGYEGLLKAGLTRPDVIISDLLMPGMDGWRMIDALRSDPDLSARIIVVTALDSGTIRDRGGLPEDVRVMRKPVPLAELRVAVLGTNSA